MLSGAVLYTGSKRPKKGEGGIEVRMMVGGAVDWEAYEGMYEERLAEGDGRLGVVAVDSEAGLVRQ